MTCIINSNTHSCQLNSVTKHTGGLKQSVEKQSDEEQSDEEQSDKEQSDLLQ